MIYLVIGIALLCLSLWQSLHMLDHRSEKRRRRR